MALTQEAFDLLLARLDPDKKRAAEKYETVRKKLIKFFEWRRFDDADACADEVIDRVAKSIDTGTQVRDLRKYFNGVARLTALEGFRERKREAQVIHQVPFPATSNADADREENQARLHCMQKCLGELSEKKLDLILNYYRPGIKKEDRIKLAEERGYS
jgi:DNA-directed RNA polymerase specialized sigma24 family protein